MLLQDKIAVVYGGGGAIGGAAARVFLAGRTRAKLERVAQDIVAAGGAAAVATLDALDEETVRDHADAVAAQAGGIDIALNAVGITHVQGTPFSELTLDEFTQPIQAYTRSHFITAQVVP